MSLTDDISQSIAQMEGWNVSGSVARRNNNPGNLRSWGNRPVVDGFAKFDTPEQGWAALNQQVSLNVNRGLSLEEFFGGKPGVYGGYAPGGDGSNDPNRYANFVAARVGVGPSVPLNSTGDGTLDVASIIDSVSPFGDPSSEAGVVDWTLIGILGLVGLGFWLTFRD